MARMAPHQGAYKQDTIAILPKVFFPTSTFEIDQGVLL
jgi:hypothetical protein